MDPAREYSRKLDERRAAARALERRDDALVAARGIVVAVGLVLAATIAIRHAPSWRWIAVPAATLAALAIVHEGVHRRLARARRAAAFHEDGIARVEERWEGAGSAAPPLPDEGHPYAADLDLFGRGSLFERLDRARTAAGEEALASWLLAPAPPGEVRDRQAAVRELAPRLDLREDVSLLGEEVRAEIRPAGMAAWARAPRELPRGAARRFALGFPWATVALAVAWGAGAVHGAFPAAALAIQALFAWRMRGRVRRVTAGVDRPARDLRLFALLLGRLERERFEAARLAALREALGTGGVPASARIRRLALLVDLLDARRNQLFAPIAALTMWTTWQSFRIEDWREAHGHEVEHWLRATGELEAVLSLAAYAFERPSDPFPEIADDGVLLEAEDLGHPLIPDARSVRNSLRLGPDLRLLVVSGSNMSGKSTLLRAVGTNAVLALAGAPCRARSLKLAPLRIAATLRIQDSLRAGASRFYAEIVRLRDAVALTGGGVPVLFLLDELLQGTNSHDREKGARALLEGLLARGAFGLVTTHDLALASIADALAPLAANVHFEDRLEDGRLVFDYRLRPGVVSRSNALELMRSVGLKV